MKNPPASGYYLRRPLVASRLLRLLDTVVERELEGTGGAAAPAQSPPPAPAAGARALVVDDSMAVRKQVGLALQREGIKADLADSGRAALELVAGQTYDVIFLDVVMPGLDGYTVCKQIKRNRERKHIPVVMLTGKSSPFDKVKGKLAGCDTYLTKPVKLSLFKETLVKYLPQAVLPD